MAIPAALFSLLLLFSVTTGRSSARVVVQDCRHLERKPVPTRLWRLSSRICSHLTSSCNQRSPSELFSLRASADRREYTLASDSARLHIRFTAMYTFVRSLGKRSKWTLSQVTIIGFCFAASIGQQKPPISSSGALHEFPLVLQQSIESGKSNIGTKVQAKLAVATTFEGTVIPRNAVFSGVVIESTPRSAKEPAKLAIRMETAEWKHGSSSITAYLLPLYYPATTQSVPNFGDAPQESGPSTPDGAGPHSSSESPMRHQSFPTDGSQSAIPEVSTTSNRPVQIKNVTVALADEGGAALVSEHSNIKLFKLTTYVFAAREKRTK